MLDDLIISEIKKQNKLNEVDNRRPQLELEIDDYPPPKQNSTHCEDEKYGTVITIDLLDDIEN